MKKDKELYKLFLNGDKEAFNNLVIMYRKQLERFIFTYVKDYDIAEDIFQDVFLYILVNPKKYNYKYELKTFLYTIAKSRSLNYIKSKIATENITDFENQLYDKNEVENIIINKEEIVFKRSLVSELSQEQQVVIELLEEGFNYSEISKILNRSIPSIKMLIYRAKNKLNKKSGKEESKNENK